jgi:hypothetical protein
VGRSPSSLSGSSFEQGVYSWQQFRNNLSLIDATVRASLKRARPQVPRIMLAQDDGLGERRLRAQKPGHFQAVGAGHADVQQNQIRLQFSNLRKYLVSIRNFAADFHGWLVGQKASYGAADKRMVVGDENAHVR